MRPVLDERTAPDRASGAVCFGPTRTKRTSRTKPTSRTAQAPRAPRLRERDFWRAVAASLLATLKPWLR